jgi:hypothetical protein
MDRRRDEDAIQRHDDRIAVLDVGRTVVVGGVHLQVDRWSLMVLVIFEVRVRDQVVPVRAVRFVHVLDRSKRQGRERRDEADGKQAAAEHD